MGNPDGGTANPNKAEGYKKGMVSLASSGLLGLGWGGD